MVSLTITSPSLCKLNQCFSLFVRSAVDRASFVYCKYILNVLLLMSTSVTKSFKSYSAKGMFYLLVSVLENLFAKLQAIQFVSILPQTSVVLRRGTNAYMLSSAYVNRDRDIYWCGDYYQPSYVHWWKWDAPHKEEKLEGKTGKMGYACKTIILPLYEVLRI